jgi:hypothetical protein
LVTSDFSNRWPAGEITGSVGVTPEMAQNMAPSPEPHTDTDGASSVRLNGAREWNGLVRSRTRDTCARARSPTASADERSDGVRASRTTSPGLAASCWPEIKNRPARLKFRRPSLRRASARLGSAVGRAREHHLSKPRTGGGEGGSMGNSFAFSGD